MFDKSIKRKVHVTRNDEIELNLTKSVLVGGHNLCVLSRIHYNEWTHSNRGSYKKSNKFMKLFLKGNIIFKFSP